MPIMLTCKILTPTAPRSACRKASQPTRRGERKYQASSGDVSPELWTAEAPKEAKCPFSGFAAAVQNSSPLKSARMVYHGEAKPIPGPNPFSLDSLMDVSAIFTDGLHVAMLKFAEKYGPEAARFQNPSSLNGATSWVFTNSPDVVQHVCSTNVRNYTRRYLPDVYKFVTHDKGILGSQDAYNTRHRKLCQPPFRNKMQLKKFADLVVERSRAVAEVFDSHGELVTDVATQTQRLTLDIVGLVAFSHNFKLLESIKGDLQGKAASNDSTDRLLWAVNTFGEVLSKVFITPMPILRFMQALGFPELRDLDQAVKTMREQMLEVIQRRRDGVAAGEDVPSDLLTALLQATDEEGRYMTDEELWEDVHDIMGAGHETTATTAAAVIYCISAHPEVEDKVVEELERVVGERPIEFEDLDRLPYLHQCVRETLRLYPAIPVFPREALEDDMLPTGHPVAAGDVVFMSSYALGRAPHLWENPLEFNPDRFSPANEAQQHKYQWLPFGAGPRMCLGANFAQMSVSLMSATLLQRHRFTPIQPLTQLIPVTYDITMNFNSTNGLKMRVGPRYASTAQQLSTSSQEQYSMA